MTPEERAGRIADQTGAHVADRAWLTRQIADTIRAAEAEAHARGFNEAVEACADWLRQKRKVKHGGFDFPALGISAMVEALKKDIEK